MEQDIKPWHREPWPWIIIGSIGFVVLACFVTLGIAIWSYDGLVADDYYKKGLTINKTLAREERSEALGLGAVLMALPDGTVRITLQSTHAAFAPPDALQLHMVHSRFPDQDQLVTLKHVEGLVYSGQITPPTEGRWKMLLEGGDWRLPLVDVQAPIGEVRLGKAAG